MIKVGTSGFSFPDWVGNIYPTNIKNGDMLSYYEKQLGFKITEINPTFAIRGENRLFLGMNLPETLDLKGVKFKMGFLKALRHTLGL